jgi:hypothetical protein
MSHPPVFAARLLLVARVLVLALLLLAVFWVVALLLAVLTAWLRGLPVTGDGLLARGAVCGLIAALFVAVFHIKKEVIQLPVPRRTAFVERLKAHLGEMGYVSLGETADRLVFRPSFRALLFGAGIRVQITGRSATVTGPKVYLELLRRRLRLQTYLDPAGRQERLLRRVEVAMRVPAEQLPRVRNDLVGALRVAGADVVCHVNILARSDSGIREAAVEEALHGWLQVPGVAVDVHKEPLQVPRVQVSQRRPSPVLAGAC